MTQAPRCLAMPCSVPISPRRDAPAPVRFGDGEVVDVDLAARLFELLELVRRQPADDHVAVQRRERDEVGFAEEPPQVVVTRDGALVRVRIVERRAEDGEQLPHHREVGRGEMSVRIGHGRNVRTYRDLRKWSPLRDLCSLGAMLTTTMLLLALTGPPVVAWNDPPPPPPMERVRGRPGWVWVEGGFEWRHGRYRRLPGHWERERPGRQWHSGRWDWRGDHYEWVPGAWVEGQPYVAPPQMVRNEPPPPPPRRRRRRLPRRRPARASSGFPERTSGVTTSTSGSRDTGSASGRATRGTPGTGTTTAIATPGTPAGGSTASTGTTTASTAAAGTPPPPPVTISGQIIEQRGRPLPGIMVVLAGSSEARVATDGDGRYVFTGLPPGSYAVRPTDPRCAFGPDVVNLNNLGSSTVQNFTANCHR